MMGKSVRVWLKVGERSDESLVAWLQVVASSICNFQLKEEEEEEEAGVRGWGSKGSLGVL